MTTVGECGICACPKSVSPHFGADCCLACAAFFRRTVALEIDYRCSSERVCRIHYELRMICRACRYAKCIASGMQCHLVQKRRETGPRRKKTGTFTSGSVDEDVDMPIMIQHSELEFTTPIPLPSSNVHYTPTAFPSFNTSTSPWSSRTSSPSPRNFETPILGLRGPLLVQHYLREERKANDRRRIMYTNHSVNQILDAHGDIPFTRDSLQPFTAKYLRETQRVELLLAYEYTREIIGIERVTPFDRMNIYKHSVLMFSVLDVGFISCRFGNPPGIIVYPNGTFQSVRKDSMDGWEAEEGLDANAKRELFGGLVQALYDDLILPMSKLNLSDVEFAITKALTLWRTCHFENTPIGRAIGMEHQQALLDGLHDLCSTQTDGPERMGTILLFISNFYHIFMVCVETYVKYKIFDLMKIDALMHQLLSL